MRTASTVLLFLGRGGLALGLTGLVINACSGKTEVSNTSSSSSSSSSGGASDGGVGPRNHPDCPAADPNDGACTKDGLVCEYGDDFNPLCNTVRVCSGTRWGSPIVYSNRPKCPSVTPTVKPNPSTCAATRAAVPVGQACTPQGAADSGANSCHYDGSTCTCEAFCESYPVRMPDCDADAGITQHCCDTTKIAWHCFDGPKLCTSPRPRVGSPCTTEGEECALTEPDECGQPTLACKQGIWTLPNNSCPISNAHAKRDIAYAGEQEIDRLHSEIMSTRLATYRYKGSEAAAGQSEQPTHLGFIIEDMPAGSSAVLPSRDRVDLYGYTSMAVAAIQHQQREIDALKAEVKRLAAENEARGCSKR